jgi:hypothetical protein
VIIFKRAKYGGVTAIIPALGRLRQEYWEFQANLGYTVKHCVKNKQKQIHSNDHKLSA